MATTTPIDTYKVIVTLAAPEGTTAEELEETTISVDDVLRDAGYEAPFGATASCTFDPMAIEIDLLIDANSPSLVQRRVSEVLASLEGTLSIGQGDEQTVTVRRGEVCA